MIPLQTRRRLAIGDEKDRVFSIRLQFAFRADPERPLNLSSNRLIFHLWMPLFFPFPLQSSVLFIILNSLLMLPYIPTLPVLDVLVERQEFKFFTFV